MTEILYYAAGISVLVVAIYIRYLINENKELSEQRDEAQHQADDMYSKFKIESELDEVKQNAINSSNSERAQRMSKYDRARGSDNL